MAQKRTVAHGTAAHEGTKWQLALASPFRTLSFSIYSLPPVSPKSGGGGSGGLKMAAGLQNGDGDAVPD